MPPVMHCHCTILHGMLRVSYVGPSWALQLIGHQAEHGAACSTAEQVA